ncbi:polyprotein [Canna indica]|uniref:Polyprotein n=1 Tax=Canna indica TaxID=4628 RepID=A0AAQ3L1B2_9LILI|nr:polyprotein [Canna indica]
MSHEDLPYLVGKIGSWQPQMRVSKIEYECQHQWKYCAEVPADKMNCRNCKRYIDRIHIAHCEGCNMTLCRMCTLHCYDLKFPSGNTRPIIRRVDLHTLCQKQGDFIKSQQKEIDRLEELVKSPEFRLSEKAPSSSEFTSSSFSLNFGFE